MTDGAGLAGVAAAGNADDDVKAAEGLSEGEGLANDGLEGLETEVLIQGTLIDGDIAFAGDQTNTGDRLFPSADCAKRNYRHFSSSSLITSYR